MAEKNKPAKKSNCCPYCDEEIAEAASLYCKACQVEIFYCPKCQQPVSRDKQVCPHCGADIRERVAKRG